MHDTVSPLAPGPFSYRNWLARLESRPETLCEEIPIYSDAHFVGELTKDLGPYQFLNTVPPSFGFGQVRPALVLRFSVHLPDEMEKVVEAFKVGKSNTLSYTGGTAYDELASLLSLIHGVRAAAG